LDSGVTIPAISLNTTFFRGNVKKKPEQSTGFSPPPLDSPEFDNPGTGNTSSSLLERMSGMG
jgi:hypothetical protein